MNKKYIIVICVLLLILSALFLTVSMFSIVRANPLCTVSDDVTITGNLGIGYETRNSSINVSNGTSGLTIANCSAGKKVLGGGCFWDVSGFNTQRITSSFPQNENQWVCVGSNNYGSTRTFTARAICARLVP